ncbi:Chloroplast stem-loop binding protein of 41 kDa b, chloroplastic [Castilleja foliolosa]|uniref:Chloroplast stem-loop binding protein of 41 kDa b, chloroplastic n=1 Tax=Castilleja foliolosa TaxID=1961234 RepID=A0ABD3D2C6_9LAMI
MDHSTTTLSKSGSSTLKAGRPIPIPNSGIQVTQLGHVKDLATAFIKVLGNEKASKEVFDISGEKYVTFDGLARACWLVAFQSLRLFITIPIKEFDFGKKKPFPFRDQDFRDHAPNDSLYK